MDQARSKISKIFCGEPSSYTRFNLAQNMEGDSSQVEMKLSSDLDEEAPNSVGEIRAPETYSHRPAKTSSKNIFFAVIGVLLIFIIGYLMGYLTTRRQDFGPPADPTHKPSDPTSDPIDPEIEVEPDLTWSDIQNLLQERLTPESLEKRLRELSLDSHEAGSDGDRALGKEVSTTFRNLAMNPWEDEHYVKVQTLPSTSSNKVMFGSDLIGETKGYLSYSATGTRQGRVVYANYGLPEDFKFFADKEIELNGTVVLMKAGKISFAQKVANAAKQKAVAALIYLSEQGITDTTNLFGHVHFGSGDPYTPGFPSFNHTQFPPAQSSGLPGILAQTLTAQMASTLFKKMGGDPTPKAWATEQYPQKLGGVNDIVTVEVNNILVERMIHNVFGVIKGFVDPDRYVVIGAQRDSWGPGYAKSTVGTSMLLELASAISDMVEHERFRPRRSLVFASWSAGEYGSVGATEWLEGYLNVLNMKALTYINLDSAVTGHEVFKASASPLLYSLIEKTLKQVKSPIGLKPGEKSLYDQVAGVNWEQSVMEPMQMDDSAYPFMAFSGIPSVTFRFAANSGDQSSAENYKYFGTTLDNKDHLDYATAQRTSSFAASAAQFAGQMALRLIHDHLLHLDTKKYGDNIRIFVSRLNRQVSRLKLILEPVLRCRGNKSKEFGEQSGLKVRGGVPFSLQSGAVSGTALEALSVQWLMTASGSYRRASRDLDVLIENSDLSDMEMCRKINDRYMRIEHSLLSPYLSPKDVPFRHILFGQGSHTLQSLVEHLDAIEGKSAESDVDLFRNQFALATWTIQGCANSLVGDVWDLDNEI
ncbi:hypothetical protein JZ751_022025 [Albula glossodonta]|uniref:Transferrin receptor protein 1 n=1 Tax=Albula glossodonta TaxID=121402 RepID=A0A8T2NM41_9TELE|nr:hypothetical protein JZ751_022025 [Albula glossodonta]